MFDLQMLRGNAYREYAPIAASLQADGRHCQHSLDWQSWHILLQNDAEQVVGCSRYRPIRGGIDQLISSQLSLATCPVQGPTFRSALQEQLEKARKRGIQFGEAGAWALDQNLRCSPAAINIALMSFALAERLGGGMGLTTATTRHHSSTILKRLGGCQLGGFPAYYEPVFGCAIEVLQFDVNCLASRYTTRLNELRNELSETAVIYSDGLSESIEYAADFQMAALVAANTSLLNLNSGSLQ